MEKKFLLQLLYFALIEIRARSYANKDKRTFALCNLLHNVPLHMDSDEEIEDTMRHIFANVETFGLGDWLNEMIERFNIKNIQSGNTEILNKPLKSKRT